MIELRNPGLEIEALCAYPRQCPLQGKCHRNLANWEYKPPVREYIDYRWVDAIGGCRGFKEILQVAATETVPNT